MKHSKLEICGHCNLVVEALSDREIDAHMEILRNFHAIQSLLFCLTLLSMRAFQLTNLEEIL